MKILFFTVKREAPSAKWRILQFIPHFEKAGVQCDVEEWPAGMMARLAASKRGVDHDIVVLQKRLLHKLLLNRLRKHSKKLVFEFDDLGFLKKTGEGDVREAPSRERRFRRTLRAADAVVTTNDHLAGIARREVEDPARVHVLQSVIDLDRWDLKPPEGKGEQVTVGWMGSAPNLPSVEIIRVPLVRLCRRFEGLTFKLVCEENLEMEGVRLIHVPYETRAEVGDARSFDIAVAPLVEDAWTRGKVSTKLLSYFATGLPVVASNVTSNRIYVRDGENGFLVGTLGEWEDRLARLVEDPALRRTMGERAREIVHREFSIGTMVPRYLDLFRKLCGAPAS